MTRELDLDVFAELSRLDAELAEARATIDAKQARIDELLARIVNDRIAARDAARTELAA